MRSKRMAFIVGILVFVVAFGSQVAGAEEALSGPRPPERHGFVLKTIPDLGFVPTDRPHDVCDVGIFCSPSKWATTEWLDLGVQFHVSNRVAVYEDAPGIEMWAGVNVADGKIIDLVTPVSGRVVMDTGAGGTGTRTFSVAAGYVADPTDILLEVFSSEDLAPENLITSSTGNNGTDEDGYDLTFIDLDFLGVDPNVSIKGFRVSSPTEDGFGVRRIYVTPPIVFDPDAKANLPPCTVIAECDPDPPGDCCVQLPPDGCSYEGAEETIHAVLDMPDMPEGTEIKINAAHSGFACKGDCGTCDDTGGRNLRRVPSADTEIFDSKLTLRLRGTGALSEYDRTIVLDAPVETVTGVRDPGAPYQDFATEITSVVAGLQETDPDFDYFQIIAGSANDPDLYSPGHTTLTEVEDGIFEAVSDFNVKFDVVFKGKDGGALHGVPETIVEDVELTVGVPDSDLFIDGFESGDTSAWSATVQE